MVRIVKYGKVKWTIGINKSEIDSGIYHENEIRYFVLYIQGYEVESNRLKEGDSFTHTFDKVGNFNI